MIEFFIEQEGAAVEALIDSRTIAGDTEKIAVAIMVRGLDNAKKEEAVRRALRIAGVLAASGEVTSP